MTRPKSRSTGGAVGRRPTASGSKAPELHTLGGVRLVQGGSDETPKLGSKHLALLIYLSQEQRPMHPSEVMDILGRGGDYEKEIEALKRVVAWLRDNVPGVSIRLATDTVEMFGGLRLDTRDVDAAIDDGDAEAVAELYTGEFLEGFESGVPNFDEWARRERSRLKRAWHNAMLAAAHEAERQEQWEAAARWWQVLTARAPLRAEAVAGLLNGLARAGRMSEASQACAQYLRRLRASGVSELGQAVRQVMARHRIPVDAALLSGENSGTATASAAPAPKASDRKSAPAGPGKVKAGRKAQPQIVDFGGDVESAHHLAWADVADVAESDRKSEVQPRGASRAPSAPAAAPEGPSDGRSRPPADSGRATPAAEPRRSPPPGQRPADEPKVSGRPTSSGLEFVLPNGETEAEDEQGDQSFAGLDVAPAHRVGQASPGQRKTGRYVKHEVTSVRRAWGPFLQNAWKELAPWRRTAGEAMVGAFRATGSAILVALRSTGRGLVFVAALPVRGLGSAATSLANALDPRRRRERKAREEEKRRVSLARLTEKRPWLEEDSAQAQEQVAIEEDESAEAAVAEVAPEEGPALAAEVTETAAAAEAEPVLPLAGELEVLQQEAVGAPPKEAEPLEVTAATPEAAEIAAADEARTEEPVAETEVEVEGHAHIAEETAPQAELEVEAGTDVTGEAAPEAEIEVEAGIDAAAETASARPTEIEEAIDVGEEIDLEKEFGLAPEIDFDATDEERQLLAADQIPFGDHDAVTSLEEESEAGEPALVESHAEAGEAASTGTEDGVVWFELEEAGPETVEPPAAIISTKERRKRRSPLAGAMTFSARWLPVVRARWLPALRRRWYVPVGVAGVVLTIVFTPRLIGLIGGLSEQVPARLPEVEAPSLPKVSLPKVDVPKVTVKAPTFVETGVSKIASFFSGPLLDGPGQWLLVADVEVRAGYVADPRSDAGVSPEVLTLALETGLQQARFFNVVPRERALLARREGPDSSDGGLGLADALSLASRESYAAVVRAWVSRSEASDSVGLQVLNPAGDTLYGVTAEVAEGMELEALANMSRAARGRLGEPADEIEASLSATQVLSTSPEALRHYAEARQHAFAQRFNEAAASAQEATRQDSTFALAYRLLAESYAMLGQRTRARAALESAWRQAGRLSERERFRLLGDRHVWDGRYEDAVITYDELFKRYRDDVGALKSMALMQATIGTRGSGRGNIRIAYTIDRYDWPRISEIARYLDFRGRLPDVDSIIAGLDAPQP